MGKQTAAAMTDEDERAFLAFLRESADIRLFEMFAPDPAAFGVEAFAPREEGHYGYVLWNTAFPCEFGHGQVNADVTGPRAGWYYLTYPSSAPVITYSRQKFVDAQASNYGRVYWAKLRDNSGAFSYDVDEFEKWYGHIVRWIRKHGTQREKGAYNTYYLPDAWAKYGARTLEPDA